MKLQAVYRVEDGILKDTEIEPILGFVGVKYPHRKSKDLYVPPMKNNEKEIKTWHCCQENCKCPDFEGGIDQLAEHLMLHKGRLVKPWNKKSQLESPIPTVKLSPNPWDNNNGCNADRRFCVQLYIDDVKRILKKQGIEVIE